MARPVKTSRTYRSPVREEQAENTRRRVLDAARRLFLDRGYTGTTVAAVATEAGVSPETIYASLGGKRKLLEGVIQATILGPEAPLLTELEGAWEEIAELETPRDRLRGYVEFACGVLARTSPVHAVIRAAADVEPFAVDLRARLLEERLARHARWIRRELTGALRPGLTIKLAAQRLGALQSPELYHLVTVELGWTADQYRDWLAALSEADLLGPP
jgi:AcrR family transcriptional regulator